MNFDTRLAFFDVDSLEYRPQAHERASVLPDLAYRERMMPIAPRLDALHSYAQTMRHPLAFSVCCSGKAPRADERPDIAHVNAQGRWPNPSSTVGAQRLYYIEKTTENAREGDFIERMHDKFLRSENLRRFLHELDAHEWVVFGNGAAFCVYPVLRCLLDAGQRVTILHDVLIDSASGYTPQTPVSLKLSMLDACAKRGAQIVDYCSFMHTRVPATHAAPSALVS